MLEGYGFEFSCSNESSEDGAEVCGGRVYGGVDDKEAAGVGFGGDFGGMWAKVEGMGGWSRECGCGGNGEREDCEFAKFRHLARTSRGPFQGNWGPISR